MSPKIKVVDCSPFVSLYDDDAFNTHVLPLILSSISTGSSPGSDTDIIVCFRFCANWLPLLKSALKSFTNLFIGYKTSQRWFGELVLSFHKCVYSQRTPLMTSVRNNHISQFTFEIEDNLVQIATVECDTSLDSPSSRTIARVQMEVKSELLNSMQSGTLDAIIMKTPKPFLPILVGYEETKVSGSDDIYQVTHLGGKM